ncbi:unnamed protein product [Rhizoctonia solani]|uniref:Uncharacterized protein n=1 Tax=Rhizoctonia solani TaxID=456999 RepID=A0A8H7H7X1_9AGAM|nr:uncharacterized protein RhiXN_12295 [Rhizoctonia solani]KAF8676823.1 hypothetical protein RHS04_06225 [Rhizoctonia solani]QRW26634.1 hypothetical protein RhiXN_12295 [Rhizoctonia solani]CAE6473060.1 unnamed protein product [Rhizoctonia solani]
MDSLSLLRESLPNAKLENAEREMSMDFKAAAQSLATLFKSSKQTVKHAHDAGYAACLQDMLQFIQSGVSEDRDGMGVARVMDWVEGQLDRYREGREFESADEAIAALPPRPSVATRDESRSPRRASTSSLPSESPFDATFGTNIVTASKRRHGAINSTETRRRTRVGPAPGERDIRTPRKVKKAVPGERAERDKTTDTMDFEEEGGRDRKRSRITTATPPS